GGSPGRGSSPGPAASSRVASGAGCWRDFFLKKLNMTTKYIRIVGGSYRRTPIAVIDAPGLRPTPDRVRETLFNWLTHLWQGEFADKHVLDLFAGSGALGFEAASRGAGQVVMVETDRRTVQALRALRDKLGAQAVQVRPGDALVALDGRA